MSKFLKIIIILVIVLITGIVGVWVYSKFQNSRLSLPFSLHSPAQTSPSQKESRSKTSYLSSLSDEVFDYWIVQSTKEVFYINKKGIFKANPDKPIPVLKTEIKNLVSVNVSPLKDKILIAFGKKYDEQFSLYDLIENKIYPLPLEIKKAIFSYDGKKLLALKNNDLTITDLKGKVVKTLIKNFSLKDVNWKWANSWEIYFYDKPSSLKGGMWRYDIKKKTFEEIIAHQKGLFLRWLNPDLILKLGDDKADLISYTGLPIKNFDYYLIPSKCDLSNSTSTPYSLYCFYPKFFLQDKKGYWLEDYLKEKIKTDDNLYLFGKEKPKLISALLDVDAKKVKFFDKEIYFINRKDNKLYKVTLPLQI